MGILSGRTAFITGGSRGIGRAIGLRLAKEGANVVLAAKTSDPHPKLPGTIHSVAEEVQQAGGKALAVQCDVRFEESVQAAIDEAVKTFSGIDILINNAGAISPTSLDDTPVKKFDLMLGINARAVFVCTKLALPHLQKSGAAGRHPHVLSMSPPVRLETKWIAGISPYTMTKYGMSIMTLGFAEELREDKIAVNALWPRSVVASAALEMLLGDDAKHSRTPEIMADAACEIVTTKDLALTGQTVLDEELLVKRGYTDFAKYQNMPGEEIWADFYVDGYGEGALKPMLK